MLQEIDPAHPQAWQVAYGSSGFNQRVVFALRAPLEPLRQFTHLPYPPRLVARLRKVPTNPQQREWLDANLAAGIGSFAVEARLGGRRIIAVGVDLQCCGDSDGAWEEDRRHVEAREIRTLLDRVWTARSPDAVIVAGDFNAVRGLRPVNLLQGKHKPTYTPFIDTGDHIVVINAKTVKLTGRKEDQKIYRQHSGYEGGLREERARVVRAKRPERLIEEAVRGMLPKTKMGEAMYRKLKVYAGPDHPHAAQKPTKLEVA